MSSGTRLTLKQPAPPAEEVPAEIIADALVTIADGIKKLRNSRLNESALVLLIQHAMPLRDRPTQKQIKMVLDGVEGLKLAYLRKP